MLLTGIEHAHRKVRLAIVQLLLDNKQLSTHNTALDCSDHNSVEDYIVAYQMRRCGWGGTTEIFALTHMLGRHVYNFSRVSWSWKENCPTLIDCFLDPPSRKMAPYIYHTGDVNKCFVCGII